MVYYIYIYIYNNKFHNMYINSINNSINNKSIPESDSYKSDSGDHYVSSIRSIDNYITTNSSNVSSHIYSENS